MSVIKNNKTYGIKVMVEQPELVDVTITENGVYTHTGNYGYDEVTVQVPEPVLGTLNATSNGTFTPSAGVDGFDEVNVSVQPNLQDKTVTTNGSVTADQGYDGLGTVTVNVSTPQPAPAEQSYFYIDDASGSTNTISIKKSSSNAPDITVYKSTDKTNWESMGTTSTTTITATIPAYGRLYLKATDSYGWGSDDYNYISATNMIKVGGYLSSLSKGDGYVNDNTINGGFASLFAYNANLIDAGDLIMPTNSANFKRMFAYTGIATAPALPATSVGGECYQEMFMHCNRLAVAPNLPATSVDYNSYYSMFEGCRSLTTAPTIAATSVQYNTCARMFFECSSLTTAPALPATSIADNCYDHMFSGCTSLVTPPPALPATQLGENSYGYMFENCRSLTTAPTIAATSYYNWSCRDMFVDCHSLTTAPVLHATTLGTYACYEMFANCMSLNSVTAYMQDISAEGCTQGWLNNVAQTGDFYNIGGATYTADSGDGIPSGWTEHNSL